MSRIYSRVTRIAAWPGWCSPCERDDRPLVLTRSGPGGLASWLSGLGDDDRLLLLTCRVCGQWQHVPVREEDDPEVVLEDEVVEAVARAVAEALPEVVEAVIPPAAAAAVPAPRTARPDVPRIVTVPDPVTLPTYSPEAVEAAARVLAAARAATQRTVAPRPAPLDRSRRSSGGPTPRRTERATTVRVARAATVELPPVVGLPTGTHSVVLATAS